MFMSQWYILEVVMPASDDVYREMKFLICFIPSHASVQIAFFYQTEGAQYNICVMPFQFYQQTDKPFWKTKLTKHKRVVEKGCFTLAIAKSFILSCHNIV